MKRIIFKEIFKQLKISAKNQWVRFMEGGGLSYEMRLERVHKSPLYERERTMRMIRSFARSYEWEEK